MRYSFLDQSQLMLSFCNQNQPPSTPDGKSGRPEQESFLMRSAEPLSPELFFRPAFEYWLSRRVLRHSSLLTNAHYISPRTERDYRQYARALEKKFAGLRLHQISVDHLYEYHRERAFADGAWEEQAGANLIRKEVGMMVSMLRSARLWGDDEDEGFRRLAQIEGDVARAMSPEEQYHLLEVAGSRQRYAYVYHYIIGALQTCAATNEMRGLRIGDVNLHQCVIQVREKSAKNRFRIRTIPLETQEVIWAFESLIYRAQTLPGGSGASHHYLFPIMKSKGNYDPSRSMSDSGLKKLWEEVRTEAQMPWLRVYDLRHSGLTRMAEQGIPIGVIKSFSGHMTRKMEQHYTAISMTAKRKASASTWSENVPRPNFGTPIANRGIALCK